MTVLALDLASCTGWAVGAGDKLPDVGVVNMPSTGEEVGPFLDFFCKWLTLKIQEDQPTIIMIEAPMMPRARILNGKLVQPATTMATTRKLQGLAGCAEMVAFQQKVEIRETHASSAKKNMTGDGHAEKSDMVRVAARLGYTRPLLFDEADALGVWFQGVRYYQQAFWPMWVERLTAINKAK